VSAWTEARVVDSLRRHFIPEDIDPLDANWAFYDKFPLSTADPRFGTPRMPGDWTTLTCTVSAYLLHRRVPRQRLVIEAVVTTDGLRNLSPLTLTVAEAAAHWCAIAAPTGLLTDSALPDGWGLIEVSDRGAVRWVQPAQARNNAASVAPDWMAPDGRGHR
jgi:hypothetical protein